MSKKKLLGLEILRAFAFIMIIVQHTIGGYSIEPKISLEQAIILRFIYTISKSAVPMFVFISGVSLFYTYRESINLREFYRKRLLTVVLPYLICTIVYILVCHIRLDNIVVSIINGDTQFHLWYMGMNIRLIIFFPLILFLYKKFSGLSKHIYNTLIVFITLGSMELVLKKDLIQSYVAENLALIFNLTGEAFIDFKQFISLSPIFYLIYFFIGMYFVKHYDELLKYIYKYRVIIIIIFLALLVPRFLIIMHGDGERIDFHFSANFEMIFVLSFNIISIFFWYLISETVVKAKNKGTEILRIVSKYSFTGYLYHVLVIDLMLRLLTSFYTVTFDNYIFPSFFYCITTIMLMPIIGKVLGHLPLSKYIFGCTK